MDAPCSIQTVPSNQLETVEISIFVAKQAQHWRGNRVSQSSQPLRHRRVFVAKCETYLHLGLGLVVEMWSQYARPIYTMSCSLGSLQRVHCAWMQIFMPYRVVEQRAAKFRPLDPDTYGDVLPTMPLVAWRTLLAIQVNDL